MPWLLNPALSPLCACRRSGTARRNCATSAPCASWTTSPSPQVCVAYVHPWVAAAPWRAGGRSSCLPVPCLTLRHCAPLAPFPVPHSHPCPARAGFDAEVRKANQSDIGRRNGGAMLSMQVGGGAGGGERCACVVLSGHLAWAAASVCAGLCKRPGAFIVTLHPPCPATCAAQ